ncbi:MAG: hypothetical protein IT180_12445 [Acidobacteria bacterium]|nr:hypothetical protein [Acidobacteriota bacterium]
MRARQTTLLLHPALGLLVASLSVACAAGGGRPAVTARPPAPSPVETALMGQWELVDVEARGQTMPASGRLAFDEFNNISVRAELSPGTAEVVPPRVVLLDFQAKAVLSAGQIAYVGLQRRAPSEQMVPTASEPSAWRYFAVNGDTLRVWQAGDDGQPSGTLVFRRLP